jgi:hypothetical protein
MLASSPRDLVPDCEPGTSCQGLGNRVAEPVAPDGYLLYNHDYLASRVSEPHIDGLGGANSYQDQNCTATRGDVL